MVSKRSLFSSETVSMMVCTYHRTFEFGRSNDVDEALWTIKTDGGQGMFMDSRRLSVAHQQGAVEIWHLVNGASGCPTGRSVWGSRVMWRRCAWGVLGQGQYVF
jgi:hypothetical protein